MGLIRLITFVAISIGASSYAWAQANIELRWPKSPVHYEITFTGRVPGLRVVVPNGATQTAKTIFRAPPVIVPYVNGNEHEYGDVVILDRRKDAPSQIGVFGRDVVYLDNRGLAFGFPGEYSGQALIVKELGDSGVVVQFDVVGAGLKTYAFVDGQLHDVTASTNGKEISEVSVDGQTLIIKIKGAAARTVQLQGLADIEAKRAFAGDIETTLAAHATLHKPEIDRIRAARGGGRAQPAGSVGTGDTTTAAAAATAVAGESGGAAQARAAGVDLAHAQGRIHPSEAGVVVTDNEGEQANAWDVVSGFAVDAHAKYQSEQFQHDPDMHALTDQIFRGLMGSEIKSVKLLAEPGSGKSFMMRYMMWRINRGDVPAALKGKTFVEVDLSGIDGTRWAGGANTNAKAVLALCEKANVIPIIDEAHQVLTTGKNGDSGNSGASQIWKPALADGRMGAIMISTFGEWEFAVANDPAFDSRFKLVTSPPPSGQRLLRAVKGWAKKHNNADLETSIAELIVQLSNRYDAIGAQPRRSVRLMETIFSTKKLANDISPVTREDVLKAAQEHYRIPAWVFSHDQMREQMRRLQQDFVENFVGQETAVTEIIDTEVSIATGAADPNMPGQRLLLAGAEGQGMDAAVNIYADATGRQIFKISGADYKRREDIDAFRRAIGNAFKTTSFVTLYFDKIDLLHEDAVATLRKLLEDGKIGVPTGPLSNPSIQTADARNATVFFTTNEGVDYVTSLSDRSEYSPRRMKRSLQDLGFNKAFLDSVLPVPFHYLTKDEFKRVIEIRLRRLIRQMSTQELPIHLLIADRQGFINRLAEREFEERMNVKEALEAIEKEIRKEAGRVLLAGDGRRTVEVSAPGPGSVKAVLTPLCREIFAPR